MFESQGRTPFLEGCAAVFAPHDDHCFNVTIREAFEDAAGDLVCFFDGLVEIGGHAAEFAG